MRHIYIHLYYGRTVADPGLDLRGGVDSLSTGEGGQKIIESVDD